MWMPPGSLWSESTRVRKAFYKSCGMDLETGFTQEIYKENVTGESRSLLSQLLIDPTKGIHRNMDICSRRRTLTPCRFPYRESQRTTYQWGYKQILGHQAGWVRCQMFSGVFQESQFCSSGDLRPAGRSVVCLAWRWGGVGGGKPPSYRKLSLGSPSHWEKGEAPAPVGLSGSPKVTSQSHF